ncbi:hypothetical protein T484DRAFT_1818085 [Baffinella frigidus]|nr:hypothetical protein T484DRAFT_1818085 [Cryptophyta sp. CCMP2293]
MGETAFIARSPLTQPALTLALTMASFTDLVLACGMHAWPEEHTPFGDLTLHQEHDGVVWHDGQPVCIDLLIVVLAVYFFDG